MRQEIDLRPTPSDFKLRHYQKAQMSLSPKRALGTARLVRIESGFVAAAADQIIDNALVLEVRLGSTVDLGPTAKAPYGITGTPPLADRIWDLLESEAYNFSRNPIKLKLRDFGNLHLLSFINGSEHHRTLYNQTIYRRRNIERE